MTDDRKYKVLMIDPPEGWRYGFPKTINGRNICCLKEWLLSQGYPKLGIDFAIKYSRMYFIEVSADDFLGPIDPEL